MTPATEPVPPAPAATPGAIEVSFEFFPPKTPEMEESLWRSVLRLAPLKPLFMSVTYGAGGSTRERTHATVVRILRETGIRPAAHLTCVGATRAEVDAVARRYWDAGIRHIVALRGDPPQGSDGRFVPHPGGYANAAELVAGLQRIAGFDISVAAYPDVHPEAASPAADLDHLKRKVDAGASRAITQFFFSIDSYLRLRDAAARAGIVVPIVPGILPVTDFRRVQSFAAACGAKLPRALADLFRGLDGDAETRKLIAATVAADQCRRLQREGVSNIHFYTLNRADLTFAICHLLGVRSEAVPATAS